MPHNPHTCPLINPSVAPQPLTNSICTKINTKPSIRTFYPKPKSRQDPHRIDDRRQGSRRRASRVYALHKIFPRKDVSSALDSRSHEIRPPITGSLARLYLQLAPRGWPPGETFLAQVDRGVRNVVTGSQPCLPMIWRDEVGVGLQLQPRERVKLSLSAEGQSHGICSCSVYQNCYEAGPTRGSKTRMDASETIPIGMTFRDHEITNLLL